jgi:biotin operon repressor
MDSPVRGLQPGEELGERLIMAVRENDLDVIQRLANEGVDVDYSNTFVSAPCDAW